MLQASVTTQTSLLQPQGISLSMGPQRGTSPPTPATAPRSDTIPDPPANTSTATQTQEAAWASPAPYTLFIQVPRNGWMDSHACIFPKPSSSLLKLPHLLPNDHYVESTLAPAYPLPTLQPQWPFYKEILAQPPSHVKPLRPLHAFILLRGLPTSPS